jgi:hypothetical protein
MLVQSLETGGTVEAGGGDAMRSAICFMIALSETGIQQCPWRGLKVIVPSKGG